MKDTPTTSPSVVRRADYTPPAYLVDRVELTFDLDPSATKVRALLAMRRAAGTPEGTAMRLDGDEKLVLTALRLDGVELPADFYVRDDDGLVLTPRAASFTLEIETQIDPANNTALEGLYMSGGAFVTQNEPEGFRHITFYPDRPDVLARFTTTVIADRASCPVLLSNGNRIATGETDGGRHFARFEDPFPKPAYLFAVVAGDFARLDDVFTTRSGRRISLEIYASSAQIGKCGYALDALKRSMAWDEATFGLECDLDRYAIVAIEDFNAGAMENKGLNIFNAEYVLADPETATDDDILQVEATVAHEYFHNWTGNRVTCRDWFQLSLKEGLTVFRDQEFSSDQNSRAVKRIEDARSLRSYQFAEDRGAMSHPVRPDSYQEINNFYTATVYDKGAEVVRMLHTLLGQNGFRRGFDLYIARHDGQAVTCDDFVCAMEDANGVDLAQFRRWYSQSGTPNVLAHDTYDPASRTYRLNLAQATRPTADQAEKHPLHLPLAVGLIGPDGKDIPLRLAGETGPGGTTRVLELTAAEQSFVFEDVPARSILSLNRGFSAPVLMATETSDDDLVFRLAHDSDPFNRWDAGQELQLKTLLELARDPAAKVSATLLDAFGRVIDDTTIDVAFKADLLSAPGFTRIAGAMETIDVDGILRARRVFRQAMAETHRGALRRLYDTHRDPRGLSSGKAAGARALRDAALARLMALEDDDAVRLCVAQFENASCMTDALAALGMICDLDRPERDGLLARFYARWKHEPLVLNKWFTAQAYAARTGVLADAERLVVHPDYDMRNPNMFSAVVGAFAGNPHGFHAADGSGYRFVADQVLALDPLNPQTAARTLKSFARFKMFVADRRELMRAELERIARVGPLSAECREIVAKSLAP